MEAPIARYKLLDTLIIPRFWTPFVFGNPLFFTEITIFKRPKTWGNYGSVYFVEHCHKMHNNVAKQFNVYLKNKLFLAIGLSLL